MKQALSILAIILFSASSTFAQVPESFKYQAIVRNAAGDIISNQFVRIQMQIIEGSSSGSSVYSEIHTPTTNNFGLINLNIGEGTVESGNFSTIAWDSNSYFVKISIDISGGTTYTEMGTSQLLSVPYALHAKTSETSINDEVDDADADPSNELQSISILGNDITLSEGGGSVTIPSSALWTESGSNLYYNAGNVAVGTNSPEANSNIYIYRPAGDFGAGKSGIYSNRRGASGAANGGTAWSASGIDAAIKGYSYYGNNYSAGVAAFSYLDYNNSSALVAAEYGGASSALLAYKDTDSKIWSGFFNGDVNFTGNLYQNGTLFTGGSGSSLWSQNGSNVYYNSGNVGIGTTSPTNKLTINGGSDVNGTNGGFLQLGLNTGSNIGIDNNEIQARNNGNPSSLLLQCAGGIFRVHSEIAGKEFSVLDNGNVGIGTNNPTDKLDIRGKIRITQGNDYDVWIQGGSVHSGEERNLAILGLDEDFGDILIINHGGEYENGTILEGKVGVGTRSPNAKLDVKGDTDDVILFEVKDKDGNPVFSVYPDYVRVTVPDDGVKASHHGAFVVSGRSTKGDKGTIDITRLTKGNYLIGHDAGTNINTTGIRNTIFGFEAGKSLLGGKDNVAIGYEALRSNTNGTDNIAIGTSALKNFNRNDSEGYNVGIGRQVMLEQTTGHSNVAIGWTALRNGTSNVRVTAIGYNAGYSSSSLSYENSTALGYYSRITAHHQVRIGNSNVTSIGGYANWTNISDERFKTNVKENVKGLDFITKLRPVTYNLDMDAIANFNNIPDSLRLYEAEKLKKSELQIGFIAQEVEAVANELDFDFHGVDKPKNKESHYGLRYVEFVAPLVKAVQEQQVMIKIQQIEINDLKLENKEIKKRLEALENK